MNQAVLLCSVRYICCFIVSCFDLYLLSVIHSLGKQCLKCVINKSPLTAALLYIYETFIAESPTASSLIHSYIYSTSSMKLYKVMEGNLLQVKLLHLCPQFTECVCAFVQSCHRVSRWCYL